MSSTTPSSWGTPFNSRESSRQASPIFKPGPELPYTGPAEALLRNTPPRVPTPLNPYSSPRLSPIVPVKSKGVLDYIKSAWNRPYTKYLIPLGVLAASSAFFALKHKKPNVIQNTSVKEYNTPQEDKPAPQEEKPDAKEYKTDLNYAINETPRKRRRQRFN
ncbi:hypothetical protein TVAG_137660 [Trichomonas vaginalis G3]|uniref:Uncharacterized protein n=1 Tax=Trichomonas vaginalis (strain ATCC PRA-98 / G3) TaxID=412133 RepID=A2EC01_TRIV3|nr:hypothetical protein TVAG_137660 [Trichomonas vaginalis G3]|eukprot:XP_001321999.1 hypothetical protein [Trichomonas vaginalis G3]